MREGTGSKEKAPYAGSLSYLEVVLGVDTPCKYDTLLGRVACRWGKL